MPKQNVLVIGAGGREHALAWKLAQSPNIGNLYVAPGNGGTGQVAKNVPIAANDITKLVDFAKANDIDITVVGPDDALAAGCVDAFNAAGLRAYGPTRKAAQIESSKAFAKRLMKSQNIPTAHYATFTDLAEAKKYASGQRAPLVVKASGLALGKGVYICQSIQDAHRALEEIMENKIFGEAGREVVIEQYLTGQEVSIHAFCDGKTAVLFPSAQDHKRVGNGDTGPNTGGMGTFAPVPWVTPELLQQVQDQVVQPVLAGLAAEGEPFKGTIYPGLMVESDAINVLEYNARFGDPETQSYMRLLKSDLLDVVNACVDGNLDNITISWDNAFAVTVVLASGGYPGKYRKGLPITGITRAAAMPDVVVFHAGTSGSDEAVLTNGGRVLCVTATGDTLAKAKAKAYAAANCIEFEGKYLRTDIADKSLQLR